MLPYGKLNVYSVSPLAPFSHLKHTSLAEPELPMSPRRPTQTLKASIQRICGRYRTCESVTMKRTTRQIGRPARPFNICRTRLSWISGNAQCTFRPFRRRQRWSRLCKQQSMMAASKRRLLNEESRMPRSDRRVLRNHRWMSERMIQVSSIDD